MDPNTTWVMLCDALQTLEKHPHDEQLRAHVITLLEALTRWLRQGGFPPVIQQHLSER